MATKNVLTFVYASICKHTTTKFHSLSETTLVYHKCCQQQLGIANFKCSAIIQSTKAFDASLRTLIRLVFVYHILIEDDYLYAPAHSKNA